jgi:hypothetical protein
MSLPKITAVQNRSVLTVAMLKLHLRLTTTTEDSILSLYLAAAKQKADSYTNNPFLSVLKVAQPIPLDVEVWCLRVAAKTYSARVLGIHKEGIQDLGDVQYEKMDNRDIIFEELTPYRLLPGGIGGSYFLGLPYNTYG